MEPIVPGRRSIRWNPQTTASLGIGIYYKSADARCAMADTLRITVDELRGRMEAGEDFTVIDVRNPQAWAQSDVMLPEAIRVPLEKLDETLAKIPREKPIVTYCT
jgi:hypothetical protein